KEEREKRLWQYDGRGIRPLPEDFLNQRRPQQVSRHTKIRWCIQRTVAGPPAKEHAHHWRKKSARRSADDFLGDRSWGQVQGSSGRFNALRGRGAADRRTNRDAGKAH